MLRVFMVLFEKYGLDALQLGVIGFCFWKLFVNHLRHLSKDVKNNAIEIKEVSAKLDNTNKDIGSIKERVSTIEGKLDI